MNEDRLETIKEKIAKLKRHQESAQKIGSIQEAAAFAGKIQELLTEYNLELSEIRTEEEAANQIELFEFDTTPLWKRNESTWIFQLCGTLSRNNFGRCIGLGVKNAAKTPYRLAIIAEEHNREIIVYLLESVVNQLRQLEKYAWKEYKGLAKRNAFRRDYFLGAIRGVDEILDEKREEIYQAQNQVQGLMIRNETALSEKVNKEFGGRLRGSSMKTKKGFGANSMGKRDARKVKMNRGISNGDYGKRRLN